ncbi:hypothetical protein AK830_g3515 [Neonectria ditissima]|uniref:Putative gamma-glutamylcyclotransferase n=1 Tax=Neonectria ditissima TaxID=78410 RepID=A0A0P7AYG3_9HYPO|nr:hypothetical protein AK830_g3515 [Neonectria ditissima]
MDVLDILASMVQSASLHDDGQEPDLATIQQWQHLFSYSFAEAEEKIKEHRSNDNVALVVSDAHWEMIRHRDDLSSYSKEAYEHSLELARKAALVQASATPVQNNRHGNRSIRPVTYLVKLDGPVSTVDSIMTAGCLSTAPKLLCGTDSSGGSATFCHFYSILQGFQGPVTNFTSSNTRYRLNFAQYRYNTATSTPSPSQNQFPVWYFFYGTLADSDVLARVLGDEQQQQLPNYDYRSARIRGGILKTWGGRYQALVDDPDGGYVKGSAFLVVDENQEDALRVYETDQYEVVRCTVEMEDGLVDGLTFKFVGEVD